MKQKYSSVLIGFAASVCSIAPAFAGGFAPLGAASEMPPQAHAGQCYARVLIPAVYKNIPTEVVTQEAYQNFETRDPTFRSRPETVVTRDGYTRYIVTEPTFRTEQYNITTRPSYERLVAQPAQVAARNETVVIREPTMVWRRGKNLSGVTRLDSNTGEIYCLVEEKGITQTITRKVVVKPSFVKRVVVPAEVKTLTRQVLATPAGVKEVQVPAETATIRIDEIASPAMERKVTIPEQRGTINRQELVTPEHYEWVQVECDHSGMNQGNAAMPQPPMPPMAPNYNRGSQMLPPASEVRIAPEALESLKTSAYSVSSLQTALAKRGYYRGPIDGIYGERTRNAVSKFQQAQGFAVNGRADGQIARALGL